jgi:hypothetical protein
MDDSVATYCEASVQRDIDRLMTTLTPDCEVVSPLSGRMVFRGQDDVRTLLDGVYGTLRAWSWGRQTGDGTTRLVIGEGRVAGLRLDDAMVFELADDGLIRQVRPHLRPWLATTLFALSLGPRIARRPGCSCAR